MARVNRPASDKLKLTQIVAMALAGDVSPNPRKFRRGSSGRELSLESKDYLSAAASILAIEAYHAGTVRTVLGGLGQQAAANAISAVRASAGNGKEQGLSLANLRINTSPADTDSLAFRRTTAEVLNIVYNGRSTGGGFLPDRANGTIR